MRWMALLLVVLAVSGCGAMGEHNAAGAGGAGGIGGSGGDYRAGERYGNWAENEFVDAEQDPVATFGLDVDTASYALGRRDLRAGWLPIPDGVRTEEYLNSFDYGYEPPPTPDGMAIHLEAAPSPFGEGLHLVRVGIKAATVERGPANLVFLVDVSGSMEADEKLGLVKRTLSLLVDRLRDDDTVAIVTYANDAGVRLEPTSDKNAIRAAIDGLTARGATNGEGGIRTAYELAAARRHLADVNRVVLCTDGDFNVGLFGDELIALIEKYRDLGIQLTTLGFGRGNYNDYDMERLADHGDGNYAYIDSEREAEKVLGRNLLATMVVVAPDAAAQINFNPQVVKRWRLLGYENRPVGDEQFLQSGFDAGDVGAGSDVTALLELELQPGASGVVGSVQVKWSRYGSAYGFIGTADVRQSFDEASPSFRLAAAVAEFAEILRESNYSEGARFDEIRAIVEPLAEGDEDVEELLELIDRAAAIRGG